MPRIDVNSDDGDDGRDDNSEHYISGDSDDDSNGGNDDSNGGNDDSNGAVNYNRLGQRPADMPVLQGCRSMYPMLTSQIPQEHEFHERMASFSRIFGNRCVDGVTYTVPDGDGSRMYLIDCLIDFLEKFNEKSEEEVQKRAREAHAATVSPSAPDGSSHGEELITRAPATTKEAATQLRNAMDNAPANVGVQLHIPQLKHVPTRHTERTYSDKALTVTGLNAIISGDGDQWVSQQLGAPVPDEHSNWNAPPSSTPLKIRVEVKDGVAVEVAGGAGNQNVLSVTMNVARARKTTTHMRLLVDEASPLLDPSCWDYERVTDARKQHVANKADPRRFDPFEMLLISAVWNGTRELWALAMLSMSGGLFRSKEDPKRKDDVVLSTCDVHTGLWRVDHGKHQVTELCGKVKRAAAGIVDSEDFDDLVKATFKYLPSLLPKSALKRKRKPDSDDEEEGEEGEEAEEPMTPDKVVKNMRRKCKEIGDNTGMPASLAYAKSAFATLVLDQNYVYDSTRQVNFSNGLCYDPVARCCRRIRPSDGAMRHINYAYPTHNSEADAALEEFSTQVIPDPEARRFRETELAHCLEGAQTQVVGLFTFGPAGCGKGTQCEMAFNALGGSQGYAYSADRRFLTDGVGKGAEGASPALLAAKGMLWIWLDEPEGFTAAKYKTLLGGGGEVTARKLYGDIEAFFARFNMIELTFNDNNMKMAKDPGTVRRTAALNMMSQFVEMPSEAAANELMREREERAALRCEREEQRAQREVERAQRRETHIGEANDEGAGTGGAGTGGSRRANGAVDNEARKDKEAADKEEAADAVQANEDKEEANEDQAPLMWPERKKLLLTLGPQLMYRLIQIHSTSNYPDPRFPAEVERATAKLWATTIDENPLQKPMNIWYKRCNCMPKDATDDSTEALFDNNGAKCPHTIAGSRITEKLKKKVIDGVSLYKIVKGRGRSDEAIHAMLRATRIGGYLMTSKRTDKVDHAYAGIIENNAFAEILQRPAN